MAIIRGAVSQADADVETVSKSLKVIQYDSKGNLVFPGSDGRYTLPVLFRATAAIAAGSLIWAMRNPAASTKSVWISRAMINVGFDGTAVAGSSSQFELVRFASGTPTGGTALSVRPTDTTAPTSSVTDARVNASGALGVTGVIAEPALFSFGIPRSITGGAIGAEAFENDNALRIGPGEGLAIRAVTATVVGDTITGRVGWQER